MYGIAHGDSTSYIKTFTQGLHAVMSSRFGHVCQVSASCLWVVQEHGRKTLVIAAQPTGDKDLSM